MTFKAVVFGTVGSQLELSEDEEVSLVSFECESFWPQISQMLIETWYRDDVNPVEVCSSLQGDLEISEGSIDIVLSFIVIIGLRNIGLKTNLKLENRIMLFLIIMKLVNVSFCNTAYF